MYVLEKKIATNLTAQGHSALPLYMKQAGKQDCMGLCFFLKTKPNQNKNQHTNNKNNYNNKTSPTLEAYSAYFLQSNH